MLYTSPPQRHRAGHFLILFLLFFLICLGLGYPTLKRYDPRAPGNNSDSADYYPIVRGEIQQQNFRSYRVLVPLAARPLYRLTEGRTGHWDPVLFSLLVINSLFTAATALLLACIGYRVTGDYPTAFLGATIYLLNFAVANFQLAGLVDSGEAFFMLAVGWSLLNGWWLMLPVLAIPGAMAKETFVPLSAVVAVTWLLAETRTGRPKAARAAWILFMAAAGIATLMAVQAGVSGHLAAPWQMAVAGASLDGYFTNLAGCFERHEFWYVFGWLLPLGIFRLRSLPQEWVIASLAGAFAALVLGAAISAEGNVARAMFDAAGPMLSLSVAIFIAKPADSRAEP